MRNPERVTMVYVRGDDHALSVPIRCTTHLEVRSPQFVGRKRTARRQPRHTFYSPNLPKSQLQKTLHEIAPEPAGHGLPLSKCEAYNRVYEQSYGSVQLGLVASFNRPGGNVPASPLFPVASRPNSSKR